MTVPRASGHPTRPHRIAVLALERVLPMEAGMPFHILGQPQLPYELMLCGRTPGPVETHNGWPLTATYGLDTVRTADTVIVPAFRGFLHGAPHDAAAALRQAHHNGARIASICTEAFALASAGLLDGRRATTHWRHTDDLARLYPKVEVDPDVLYVDTGNVLTSAGVASGIDLCLHLLRRDHGTAIANAIAREIVAAPHREGGQAQFIKRPPTPSNKTGLGATLEWALTHLDKPLTVADLAPHARLSTRTFARSFAAETGTTPMKWLNTARIDRARELLETTHATISNISQTCGLGTPANFRQHFRRTTGTTPSEYRQTFTTT
ncbi:GlxA family transcriptional regulator [Streptomyces malaysiensis]|uniref:GlxA family transcriptional regulator n=1 Tax=Streptomyces malaysiensis TaxID=92644 RepID=UPI000853748C|nr:helix-turn-helix domain-containing protein [Streptomyces sp. SPMA113]